MEADVQFTSLSITSSHGAFNSAYHFNLSSTDISAMINSNPSVHPIIFSLSGQTLTLTSPKPLDLGSVARGSSYTITITFPVLPREPAIVFDDTGTADYNAINIDSTSSTATLTTGGLSMPSTITFSVFVPLCLHGSCLISTSSGPKRLDTITSQDQVLTATGEYAPVQELVKCWIQPPGPDHDSIVFEPYSLTSDLPTSPLIIDPGHPICLPHEFAESGLSALKPSGSYRKEHPVIKYQHLPEQTSRYDLILAPPHQTYIASGIIVKSRTSLIDAGYHHTYQDMI